MELELKQGGFATEDRRTLPVRGCGFVEVSAGEKDGSPRIEEDPDVLRCCCTARKSMGIETDSVR